MEKLISAFWFSLEYIFCYLFWSAFLTKKASNTRIFCFLAAAWVTSFLYTNIGLNQIVKIAMTFSVHFVVTCFLYDGAWYRRIFVTILGYAVSAVVDTAFLYGISMFLGISLSEFACRQMFYVATVTIGKFLTVFLAWMLQQYRSFRNFQSIEAKWLMLSALFPAVSLSMIIAVFDSNKGHRDLSSSALAFSGILAIANIAIIYLITIMEKSTKNAQETALLKQQMEIQTNSILALEKSHRAQRQATHDFRNQLQTINDLLTNGEPSAALEYIHQLQGMQTTRIFTVNSHHPIIDAIMNHKYQTAKEQDIDVQVQVNDLSRVSIETDLLVVLLSNLLDNAIEACALLSHDRVIQCRMLATDCLYISIRNTSNPVILIDNYAVSTKEPREDHGYGIARIHHILNILNAEFTFTYQDGWFEFVAEIPRI